MVNKLNNALEFFSKLTNAKLDADTAISLSSAQKSRAYAWLEVNKIPFQEQLIHKKFSLNSLLNISHEIDENNISSHEENTPKFMPPNNAAYFGQVGIDIQRIDELFPKGVPSDLKSDSELKLIFTSRELTYAEGKENTEATLTGIFAAKEAILKTGFVNRTLAEIEVLPNQWGQPIFDGASISISHSGNYAVAMAYPSCPNSTGSTPIQRIENEERQKVKLDMDTGLKDQSQTRNLFDSVNFWKSLSLALAIALLLKLVF